MPGSYQLLLGGAPADAALTALVAAIVVEESMELPGAVQIDLSLARSKDGDLTLVDDSRFAPMSGLAVVASPPGRGVGAAGTGSQCIFDGYVLAHRVHLESGTTRSVLTVSGQDASWPMSRQERVREWVDVSDVDVAGAIFAEYGITPAADNDREDPPSHNESGHSLMQRGADGPFLRMLARRGGRLFRVACADRPGQRTGYFAAPSLDGSVAATIRLNDPVGRNTAAIDLEWDVTRPTAVVARQALFTDADPAGASGDTDAAGLTLLGEQGAADFAGGAVTMLLAAQVDDAGELGLRAQAVLREADWFVRCRGETDASRLGTVLRAGMLVALEGIGAVYSGKYLVWNVRHRIARQAHTMRFTLVRNAVGQPGPGKATGAFAP